MTKHDNSLEQRKLKYAQEVGVDIDRITFVIESEEELEMDYYLQDACFTTIERLYAYIDGVRQPGPIDSRSITRRFS